MAATESPPHQPVLFEEIIHALQPRSSGRYVDATIGAGGHARGILEACAPDGHLLGFDLDPQALALARETLAAYGKRVTLVQASFETILDGMRDLGWHTVDGILMDLGASSMQLDTPERGFSFQSEAPLDMRFDPGGGLTAAQLVNTATESELADTLFQFGEEPRARKIARLIVAARPLNTTAQLATVVKRAYHEHHRLHPATRTFQALRIAVNDELGRLERALPKMMEALQPGGRLAVISFHSLEDRIVKRFLRGQRPDNTDGPDTSRKVPETNTQLRELNRKPILASGDEIGRNPRSRSARLRVAERL